MSVARKVSTVGSATLASRVLALVRDIGIAAVLGAGAVSDAYFAALQIPNLFRRLSAEGAVNSAFVPIWLRLRSDRDADPAHAFAQSVFGSVFAGLAGFTLIVMVLAPVVIGLIAPGFDAAGERFTFAVEFLRLSVPYVAIIGVVAIASALLNAEGHVAAAAGSIVVFNCVLVASVLIILPLGLGESQRSGAILAASFVVAGIAQAALVGAALWRLPRHPRRLVWKPSEDARLFYARALPALTASGIPQLTLIVGTIVASSSAAAVSWLYYAYRLYELPLGVISTALASVLAPRIAASVHAGTPTITRQTQSQALELALGLALPAAVGLAILALPIAGLLFERGAFTPDDTLAVAAALAVIVIGLPGHALEKVLGAIAFAHEDTRTPMQAALAGLAVAAAIALALAPPFGHVGVAAGIAAAGWVSSGWLTRALLRRGRFIFEPDTVSRLTRIGMAAAIMAVTLVLLLALLLLTAGRPVSTLAQVAALAALIVAGIAVYAACLQWFRIVTLRELLTWRT